MQKLGDLRGDYTVFSGLSHPEQQGNNGHASELTWLTGAQRPGLAGFRNTIHRFQFVPGGAWLLTMHGPDGADSPNESRFLRVVPDEVFEIEHLSGHHFVLTLGLADQAGGTLVSWCQTFDSAAHYQGLAAFVAAANEQNLDRLAAEVERGRHAG